MYKHILIPTDGSDTANRALRAGIEFAREARAKITFFTAVPEYVLPRMEEGIKEVISLDEHHRRAHGRAERILAPALDQARAAGLDCDTDYAENDSAYRAIIEAAKRHQCDVIFMGTHARTGLAALWHGSQTMEVVTHSDVPTVIYHS